MKKQFFIIILLLAIQIPTSFSQNSNNTSNNEQLQLCAQAWTFNKFTFAEALDKMKVAGINKVEMFPDQQIGNGIDGVTHFTMNAESRDKIKVLLKAKGIELVNYGVAGAKDRDEWIKLFEFAKAMGIKTIIAEPDSNQLNFIEPLCEKYQVYVALHNHPNPKLYGHPAIYWNPDSTLSQIKNRNKYIGVCADMGHWLRSGLDPLVSLKRCRGRVLAVHAKDLIPAEDGFCGYHDVPWGTGMINFSGIMHELKQQGYQGTITLEYEYNWFNSLPEITESVVYFNYLSKWINKE